MRTTVGTNDARTNVHYSIVAASSDIHKMAVRGIKTIRKYSLFPLSLSSSLSLSFTLSISLSLSLYLSLSFSLPLLSLFSLPLRIAAIQKSRLCLVSAKSIFLLPRPKNSSTYNGSNNTNLGDIYNNINITSSSSSSRRVSSRRSSSSSSSVPGQSQGCWRFVHNPSVFLDARNKADVIKFLNKASNAIEEQARTCFVHKTFESYLIRALDSALSLPKSESIFSGLLSVAGTFPVTSLLIRK